MRLQRLEINGFKSFSDRSELAFDDGVTAIVGPNGCGKSNVADAITWVMGEQSAKSLRGERMEDVLFSGSDARKPTASAEVRLRFSGFVKTVTGPAFNLPDGNGNGNGSGARNGSAAANGNGHHPAGPSDGNGHPNAGAASGTSEGPASGTPEGAGDVHSNEGAALETPEGGVEQAREVAEIIQSVAREVEVTRRLYRSGESEYLIDGQICRLKDIHDLLMDTGLGAKAYAIIEQGKIGLILSSRPTDRRQLIEEAAGVTKYKARRRAAELKLEAAQQNLTRIDDIVFEVDKQRGTLKRQAAKARRYRRLRDELRQWEKVLFARRYRQLAEAIQSTKTRLSSAREDESSEAGRVAGIESDLERLRIELTECESRATRTREAAHAREIAINRLQQQMAFDREQVQNLQSRGGSLRSEIDALDARREPARAALEERRAAASAADAQRDRAARALVSETEAYDAAHREIEGLEADVEAARSEVFSAINSATALRHALEHAAHARDRVAETLSKLDVEMADVRIESDRVEAEHSVAADRLRRTQEAIASTHLLRSARESELASARIEHEWRARAVRAHEQDLAGLTARLKSLEELEAARAGYGDAARAILVRADGQVNPHGALADYLDVEAGYERAVQACLGDLLEHVIVERPDHAAAGFRLVREAGAGRCGFLVTSAVDDRAPDAREGEAPEEVRALSSVLRITGPFNEAIRCAIGDAWIAPSYDSAARASAKTRRPVATLDGELFHGPYLVAGGHQAEARGILETKREINELRDRIAADREALGRLATETMNLEGAIAHASSAIAALDGEDRKLEKTVIVLESQLEHAVNEQTRLAQKAEQLARERHQAEEERDALDRRQDEARISIARLEGDQRLGDERLTVAQRRLFEAREAADELSRRAAEAGAAHAALVERASALASEVGRLEEQTTELEERATSLSVELEESIGRVKELQASIAASAVQLDDDIRALDDARRDVMAADQAVTTLRVNSEDHEASIKDARRRLDAARSVAAELDVARATAEADLSHIAHTCEDAVNATLDEVLVEVEQMERDGRTTPDANLICADEPPDDLETAAPADARVPSALDAPKASLSAEEAIAELRRKIERLGPVNMMAIDQFDELEARHLFLSTQRNDLVQSIAQTTEAIKRIDETTRRRFSEAFAAINANFQETFSALFGGGRAGLTLMDESDPLESGIEIIAQPPGKRLQSVQLLSGGEKALTAIALMFAMFRYKPSPFCLLDEIDAPLDDANIGRFVGMLRGMQQHTQFIVITHNRKTMEIADRLYGVTMEEPGVSKLISVQLN